MSRTKITFDMYCNIARVKQAISNNERNFLLASRVDINKLIDKKPDTLYSLLETGIKTKATNLTTLNAFLLNLNPIFITSVNLGPLLMLATQEASADKVLWLVSIGANVNHQDDNLATPLLFATSLDCAPDIRLKIIKTLLDKGAEPSLYIWDNFKDNPFVNACVANDKELLELFCGYDVNSKELPQYALSLGDIHDVTIAQLLVAKGAKVNNPGLLKKAALLPDSSLLIYYLSICDKLLINLPDVDTTPLEAAIIASLPTNVSVLLSHGAEVSQKTLLSLATVGSAEVAKIILGYVKSNGVDISALPNANLLAAAVLSDNHQVIKVFAEYGIDVNQQNGEGNTALHLALKRADENPDSNDTYECIRELLSCHANIYIPDMNGIVAASYKIKNIKVSQLIEFIHKYEQNPSAFQNIITSNNDDFEEIKDLLKARYDYALLEHNSEPDSSSDDETPLMGIDE